METNGRLFSSFKLRDGFELSNRIVFAPVYLNIPAQSEEFREFYIKRARGGTGLIVMPVPTPGGFSDLYTPSFREASQRLMSECRDQGAWIIPQVFSGVGDWVNTMNESQISAIPESFAECAEKLKEIGFPGMEIHGAHHSFFMHLLSPAINRRKDRLNGPLEARSSIQIETVEAIKSRVGSGFTLFYRISATDLIPGGFILDEAKVVSLLLQKAGLDCLDVSAGGTALSPKNSECPDKTQPEACFAPYFSAIKKILDIPVIGAGRIASPESAEGILVHGDADLVALCRPLVSDPFWPDKVRNGNAADILPMDDWYRNMPAKN